MANDALLGREAVVAAIGPADAAARLGREAVAVGHHWPEDQTPGRLARMCVVVAISRPHGWDVFADSPMIAP